MEPSSSKEIAIIDFLRKQVENGKKMLAKGSVIKMGHVQMVEKVCIAGIRKIYGAEHKVTQSLKSSLIPKDINPAEGLQVQLDLWERYINSIERAGENSFLNKGGGKIFIGHGQSSLWREVKDFLHDRLSLPWDEFNREATAGIVTFERISEMLDSASFALLIMTAEDQHVDSTTHARQNVVHEVGLFQGRLGPRKAIILLEDGCSEFSNIAGLTQIRFRKGCISETFEEIRRVLEREGVIKSKPKSGFKTGS
jgi:hypothetical protein